MANPYIYCGNNPIMYVDPDGRFFWLVPVLIGAAIGGITNLMFNADNIGNVWQGLGYFFSGAAIGAAGAGVASWAANATMALGALPGALVGSGTGAAIGGTTSIASNGLNNLLAGRAFFEDWNTSLGSGALSGGISGAFSGASEGYDRAIEKGANKWTGEKTFKKSYVAKWYKSVMLSQPDPSKNCYAYALANASSGHDNLSAQYWINKNGGAPGGDPYVLANNEYKNKGVTVRGGITPKATEYHGLGMRLQRGAEMIGVYNDHAVNIREINVTEKLKIFGGGTKTIVKTQVWDPLPGKGYVPGPSSFDKIAYIIY